MQRCRCRIPLVLPSRDVLEMLVVALRLAVLGLMVLPEVSAAALLAVERVDAHELPKLQEVRHAAGLDQCLIELVALAGDLHLTVELCAQPGNLLDGALKPRRGAAHAALFPDDFPQLPVEVVGAVGGVGGVLQCPRCCCAPHRSRS